MPSHKFSVMIAVLACFMAPLALAKADANQAIDTASKHAQMAVNSLDKKTADKHLHHVINCLVGPAGKSFDAAFENPCQGMGKGALVDIQDKAEKTQLEKALAEAERGLKAKSYETTQGDAKRTLKILQHVLSMEATGQQ